MQLPRWRRSKESACQGRRHKRRGFSPCVRKIPWSKKWQHAPISLPGKFYGQRSLVGYSLWGRKESDMTVYPHTHTHNQICLVSMQEKKQETHRENARWRDRHIYREDSHLTETETGVRQLQAKECQRLLATTRNWERDREHIPLLSPQEGPYPWFCN